MEKWWYLAGAIVLEVTGTLALRAALDHPALVVLVVIGYVGSFLCLAFVLRAGTAIGVAYGIWSAIGVTLTSVLGAVLFHDPLTAMMCVGIAVVIAGVFLVERGSPHAADPPEDEVE